MQESTDQKKSHIRALSKQWFCKKICYKKRRQICSERLYQSLVFNKFAGCMQQWQQFLAC